MAASPSALAVASILVPGGVSHLHQENKDSTAKVEATNALPSMLPSEPYAIAGGIIREDLDRLIDKAVEGESCCKCCGFYLGKHDLIRAALPCVGPMLAHFVALDVPEEAERIGLPLSVTGMIEGQYRCLCGFGMLWLPGILVGACFKRFKVDTAAVLRTYRAVYTNPALYSNSAASPEAAAEQYTVEMHRGCTDCC